MWAMKMRLSNLLRGLRVLKKSLFRFVFLLRNKPCEKFFVTGIMRSGTTLLQRVVEQSCNIAYTPECSSLSVIVNSFRSIEQYDAYQHLSRDEFVKIYRSFINSFFDEYAIKTRQTKIVFKDPEALSKIRFYLELMPTVRFVISVRNPLATIASIWRVRNNQIQKSAESPLTAMNFEQVVDLVEQLCDEIIFVKHSKNVCIVKYEDLIARNEDAIIRLKNFIGKEVNLDLSDDTDEFDPNSPFWTPETGSIIKASSLDKFKNELTIEQSELVVLKLTKFMQIFGYAYMNVADG